MRNDAGGRSLVAALTRMATIIIVTILLFGLVWVGYLYVAQDSMIYYPRGYSAEEIAAARERFATIAYGTPGAGKQEAFYCPPRGTGRDGGRGAPERIWLLFGGNAARALDWADVIENLAPEDAGYLLVDYPGYGNCEGRASPATIEESIEGAVKACAAHLGMAEAAFTGRLAVMGHSLGAAAALWAAEACGARKVVLISPFTTMREMAARAVGGPLSRLLRHDFDNRVRVRALLERGGVEMTIIHGAEDEIIPLRMGRELAELDSTRITFHAVHGADHNNVIGYAHQVIREAMR